MDDRDLLPSRVFGFPQFPSIWNDDSWMTPVNVSNNVSVSEDEANVYISAALPGITPDDVEMTFHNGYLWIKGEAKDEEKDKKRKFYRKATSSFSYRVAVPGDIDTTKEPEASYKNGVMTVTFAKSPKAQPKKIQLKTK